MRTDHTVASCEHRGALGRVVAVQSPTDLHRAKQDHVGLAAHHSDSIAAHGVCSPHAGNMCTCPSWKDPYANSCTQVVGDDPLPAGGEPLPELALRARVAVHEHQPVRGRLSRQRGQLGRRRVRAEAERGDVRVHRHGSCGGAGRRGQRDRGSAGAGQILTAATTVSGSSNSSSRVASTVMASCSWEDSFPGRSPERRGLGRRRVGGIHPPDSEWRCTRHEPAVERLEDARTGLADQGPGRPRVTCSRMHVQPDGARTPPPHLQQTRVRRLGDALSAGAAVGTDDEVRDGLRVRHQAEVAGVDAHDGGAGSGGHELLG